MSTTIPSNQGQRLEVLLMIGVGNVGPQEMLIATRNVFASRRLRRFPCTDR